MRLEHFAMLPNIHKSHASATVSQLVYIVGLLSTSWAVSGALLLAFTICNVSANAVTAVHCGPLHHHMGMCLVRFAT